MERRRILWVIVSLLVILTPAYGLTQVSDFMKAFGDALVSNNKEEMNSIVETNKDAIPTELATFIDEAVKEDTGEEDREAMFYVAEVMATMYKDKFGDPEPLKMVKKRYFEARLSEPVRSTPVDGVHIVECPPAKEGLKDVFRPDNIIIKKGETVRWVNNDNIAHIFASMPFIGEGGIFSPNIEPGGSWEYTFEKPGEYYYICFIHKGMIGKVTVEE